MEQALSPVNYVLQYPVKKAKVVAIKKYKKSTTGYTSSGHRIAHAADAIPPEDMIRIKEYCLNSRKKKMGLRNWTLVLLGCNVGQRCGDITRLRIGDVMWNGKIKTKAEYMMEKTRTWTAFYLQDELKAVLLNYINSLDKTSANDWLFPLERGDGHLTTNSVYKLFYRIEQSLDLQWHFSTHSMRKTLGRTAYRIYGVKGVQQVLRQKDERSAMHYIGVTEDEIKSKYLSIPLSGI